IQMSLNGRALTATIKDAIDNGLSSADIKLTYDGKPITFSYNSGTKALNATIPASDGLIHRVTIMATDKSGNIQRKGLTVPGSDSMAQPFIDMNSHWAKLNTAYLYNRGIVNGVKTDGGFKYIPDTGITRSEFAVIMSKWLNTDMSLYKDMALPFTDNASIPSWALDSVKAMYGMGIIQGTASGGKLYYKPNGAISREEVMTIIGRTQARGYAEADLSSFGDGNQVSSWSLPYVKTLVEQGIISGYSGKLWPKDSVTRAQVATMIFSLY
ncbi:MAG: S-layer homology domain-containing protein, partial [Eubacteriales bacterium]|nr:S-layer homology domain-containing protein [Eubacteriales bacterium]MDD4583831.1 S-layer homology domain-containing protein [Eubacteriales bacterium]